MSDFHHLCNPRPKELAWIGVCLLSCFGLPTRAADNVWSVPKLNDNKPWEQFVDSPLPTIAFLKPVISAPVQNTFLLSVENAVGKGDSRAAFGNF